MVCLLVCLKIRTTEKRLYNSELEKTLESCLSTKSKTRLNRRVFYWLRFVELTLSTQKGHHLLGIEWPVQLAAIIATAQYRNT